MVQSGLQAGERVIVEGIQKVRPGMKVQATVVPLASERARHRPIGDERDSARRGASSQPPADGASPTGQPPAPADGARRRRQTARRAGVGRAARRPSEPVGAAR